MAFVMYLKEIIRHGTGARRQRAVFKETQSFQSVVDTLIQEFKTDTPVLADRA